MMRISQTVSRASRFARSAPHAVRRFTTSAKRHGLLFFDRRHGVDWANYPPSKGNTFLNICPQGKEMVVETMGKYSRTVGPGWFLAIPFIQRIRYVHDMREMTIRIEPQEATTKDNVRVKLAGNIFVKVENAYHASYAVRRVLYATVQHAQATMRTACGTLELDELFHNREALNASVLKDMGKAAATWHTRVTRYEVTDIVPDTRIAEAMDRQAAAERKRREDVLDARAKQQAMVQISEGQRQKDINESEGVKIRAINEAEGKANAVVVRAEADARARVVNASAERDALLKVSEALGEEVGMAALRARLSTEYFKTFEQLGSSSNTIIVPADTNSVDSMMAKGLALLDSVRPNAKGFADQK